MSTENSAPVFDSLAPVDSGARSRINLSADKPLRTYFYNFATLGSDWLIAA
jgi:hypothetical protein